MNEKRLKTLGLFLFFLSISVCTFAQSQDRRVNISESNLEKVSIQTGDVYNQVTHIVNQIDKKTPKQIEEINNKLEDLSELKKLVLSLGKTVTQISQQIMTDIAKKNSEIENNKDTIKILENKIQKLIQIADDAILQLNKQKEELLNYKSTYLPFGIPQFYYNKTLEGIAFAGLQGGFIVGSTYCFVESSQNNKFANVEQDDERRKRYLQKRDNYMWGGIGCLTGFVITYMANVICNEKDKKNSLTVIPYSSPQGNGLSLVINF